MVWHSIHGQIGLILRKEHPFHCIKNLLAELALEHIIILRFDMHHKLDIVRFCTLGYRLDGRDWNFSLDLILLDVVETQVGEEQSSVLLHHPPVDLDHDAGKDHFLPALGVQLGHDFGVRCTALQILEFWFGSFHIKLKFI